MPPDSPAGPAAYELRLLQTSASTGYFAAVPEPECSWETALAYLREHPSAAKGFPIDRSRSSLIGFYSL
ncbi:MAG: hypothetical protein K9L59_09780 [Desulfobacterales bacterium]|nr:hypothetical protein [Desulfobacterales bacterium]